MSKASLRQWAKEERKKLDIEKISRALAEKLVKTNEYKQAKNIMLFYPTEFEINLLSILKDKTKNFYLPKINGKELLCCPYSDGEETCLSCFKTCEPLTEPCDKSLIDLVIVPALCCDKKNYRLGYGGGFYDKFLKGISCKTLICIPEQFIVDTIFPEEHDIPVNTVISC